MAVKLFGFTLGRKDVVQPQLPEQPSFALPTETMDDGAVTITAISHNETGKIVTIVLDKLKQPESIKKKIIEEFDSIQRMLNFSSLADDLFKRWYIDGRLNYHVVVNEKNPKEGIQELRYIDPRKIRKVREVKKERDPKTGANIIGSIAEYYVYNDKGTTTQTYTSNINAGLRIAPESIINVNSGLMDAKNTFVISYLHKAIKPLNQLRMIEDAIVIYRLSRAPERRIFYIDVGNLPKGKAEQYLRDIMVKYRNKMVYDAQTGELRDDRKHMSMLEDFWLPRREGGKGTEITTLPAGQNLGELADVVYFRQKLLNSLNVPISRLEPQQGGMIGIGRTTEVTRYEVKFSKFIQRLRKKFSTVFDQALRIQLVLKGICTTEEWELFKEDIYFDFVKDNNFTELRDTELLRERVSLLQTVDPYIGRYYSADWVRKNILQMDDELIQQMDKEIAQEDKDGSGGPTSPMGGEEVSSDQFPPEDNTLEDGANDSKTPQLDADVEKYSNINRA